MSRSIRLALLMGAAAAVSAGCPECAPDLVAVGVSQLTVRNVGAMATLVNADTTCGFASDAVLAAPQVDGDVGGNGTLTFTVTDCVIDLGSSLVDVSEDCDGNKTTASGKVTISATRAIVGTLTGNPASPVVPANDQAVTIEITSATFENFEVRKSTSTSFLTMIDGSLSATLKPRLAVAASSGVCAIATPNVSFSGIAYNESNLHVTTEDNSFDVGVVQSSLTAQNGVGADGNENTIAGTITVFGSDQTLTDAESLDPDYVAADFASSYACTEDIASPESFACVGLEQQLADGAARLSIKMLGTVAGLVDADTNCGFSSEAVLGAGAIEGAPGGEGSLTLTVTDCEITLPAGTELEPDCDLVATKASGTVTVSGTKTVTGRFTGNAASPIVPIIDQPAAIDISIVTDGFEVGSTADENALLATSGTLAGVVRPKVFLGAETGVCSVSSPNAGFDDVTWIDAELLLSAADEANPGLANTFALAVDSASLEAANGTSGSGTNELTGTVTIGGTAFTVPANPDEGLNPEFAQDALDASFDCNPELVLPLNDSCDAVLDATVAGGIGALTARTFGTVVSLVDANTTCGFSSVPVAVVGAAFAGGDVGDDGVTATFTIATACEITLPADTVVSTDCLGGTTSVSGTVSVTGTKTVTGWRTGDVTEPVVPNSSKPATFDLSMTFTGFTVETSTSTAALTVTTGALEGTVQPRLALDPTTGACSIATPNVTFADLTWTNANVTLVSDGNAFTETVATSDIDAQSGDDGVAPENTIAGSITVGGAANTLAGPLDPEFDQVVFDSTYQCAGNGSPILVPDAACSFKQALGLGAARLLVKAAATAVSVHDGNPVCGFDADAAPVPAPTGVPPALGTLTFNSAAGCQSGFVADTTIATDCVGAETHASGGFTTAAASTKVVGGLFTGVADPSFVPVTRDAALLTVSGINFGEWTVAATDAADVVETSVVIHSGAASLVVQPITGKNAAASTGLGQDVFTESTGIAAITDLTMATGDITIFSEGKTFNLTLTDVDLDAFAGAFFDGTAVVGSNDLSGSLTLAGEPVTIAPTDLNPDYDQAAFDATYTCNPALGDPPDVVPSAAP